MLFIFKIWYILEKTLYEWKQTQRRLERGYRKAQTQSDMFKESGNNIAAKDYKYKADAIRNVYDDLTNSIPGLYDHSERMRTYFKGAKSLTSGGSGGIIKATPMSKYINSSDDLYEIAKNIKPIDGYEDIVIHGDSTGFEIRGKDDVTVSQYSPREFADILREDPNYHGGNIRLISCESGKGDLCAAQMLANQLQVDVMAPNKLAWVFPNGEIVIGETEFENTGEWVVFKPQRR